MLIARTNKARKKLNKINSRANRDGYYYKPRIFLSDLLELNRDDIFITTSCVAGIIRDRVGLEEIFIPLYNHFGRSLMIEVQSHLEDVQIQFNENALELAEKYDLRLIHGNDSHYIYPHQAKERLEYLKGKGITYGDEDNFILDYPDTDTIYRRYKEQGVLSDTQIEEAIKTTLLFDECEPIEIDKSIKMPNINPELSPDGRMKKLMKIIKNKWLEEEPNIPEDKKQEYIDAITFELDIINETNEEVHTADYFLLNQEIVDRAVNRYDGRLTKSGRGSGVSYYINKLLGFTGIDRLALNVPMYPTRFISKSRLLQSKSLPDFDFNTADPEPFIRATRDLLGNNGCHWMLAYGTMKESEAFRNTCRNLELDYNEYNEVAKDLDKYSIDPEWADIIRHSKKFVGSIVSASPHPCSNIIMDSDIEEEIGVIRIGDKLCAVITSLEADEWKYLKNDYLTVSVVEIINDVFDLIGKDVIEVDELIDGLDDKVWDLYENGITTTLNQADSDFATSLVKRYKPKRYEEMSAFVAAIRPGFASLLDTFIERKPYSNGVEALDELLETTDHFILYQENLMSYLVWLGIPEDITYSLVKKVAKKSFTEEELEELHGQLLDKWIEKVGREEGFFESWQVVEASSKYSFNASHSISVAIDSLYGAYLKANYPLEYYKVVLDHYSGDSDRTNKLIKELRYFDIRLRAPKFRYSHGSHTMDKESNTIYKGIGSIKYISNDLGDELYDLRKEYFGTFIDLLKAIKTHTSCNSKQLDILIKLDYFSEFGKSGKLLKIVEMYEYIGKKNIKKTTVEKLPFTEEQIKKYADRETEKTYMEMNMAGLIHDVVKDIPDEDISIRDKIDFQLEYLGYVDLGLGVDPKNCYVTSIDTKFNPKVTVLSLGDGQEVRFKMTKDYYSITNLKVGDIIYIHDAKKKQASRPDGTFKKNGKPNFEKIPGVFDYYISNCEKITAEEIYKDRSEDIY